MDAHFYAVSQGGIQSDWEENKFCVLAAAEDRQTYLRGQEEDFSHILPCGNLSTDTQFCDIYTHTGTHGQTHADKLSYSRSFILPPSFFHSLVRSFVRSFGKSFTGLLAKNYYPSKYSSRITTTGKYSYGQGLILQADTSVG